MKKPPELSLWKEVAWVLVLLALGALLRVGFILQQGPDFFFEDSLVFDGAARHFLESGEFGNEFRRFPAYPVLMAGVYRIFGPDPYPVRFLQVVLSLGIGFCVWWIGRRLFGVRTGLLALAASVLFPAHIILAGLEYPMVPGTLLIWVTFTLFIMESLRPRPRGLALAGMGVLAGISALFFEGGLVFAACLPLWVLIRNRPRGTRRWAAAILVLATVLTLAPWVAGMSRKGDYRPLAMRAGRHLPSAPGTHAPFGEGSGINLLSAKVNGMVKHPVWTLKHMGKEFLHFWNPYPDRLESASRGFRERLHRQDARMKVDNPLVGDGARVLYAIGFSVLLIMAIAGALVAGRLVVGSGFLIAWPICLALSYSPFFTQMRYRIPADAAFLLLAAYALDLAWRGSLGREAWASLKAVWGGWKRVAEKIAVVQTFILLLLVFVLVLGPTGLLMRLFRRNPLRASGIGHSFWVLRERTREGLKECARQF